MEIPKNSNENSVENESIDLSIAAVQPSQDGPGDHYSKKSYCEAPPKS